MNVLQEVEELRAVTFSAEEQLRKWRTATTEVFPGIFKTPGVCGGDACVGSTRLSVWGLVEWQRLGLDDAKILEYFPHLSQQHLDDAWKYARAYPEEIERQIEENSEENIERLIAEHIAEDKNAAALYR